MAGLRIFLCLLICTATAFVVDGALTDLEQALLPQRSGGLTTKGTEFTFAFMGNDIDQGLTDQNAVIIVTNDGPRPVEVTVEVNSAFYDASNVNLNRTAFPQTQRQSVESGSSVTFTFSVVPNLPNEDIRVYQIEDLFDRNSGIRVTTDGGEVSVYAINNELQSVDAFSVFPCYEYPTRLSMYEYIVVGAPVNTESTPTRNNSILIVGCQDDTDVEVIPPFQFPTISASVPVNLGGGQTPRPGTHLVIDGLNQLTSLILNVVDDPTGTRILSTKPIAVFTGHQCANVPSSFTLACDHVVQQVPPQLTWGTRFFTVPVIGRYSGDHYRVVTATANTEFTLTCRTLANPTPTIENFPINFNDDTNSGFEVFNTNIGTTSGDRASRKDDLQWCCIESNNPVLVMQYAQGQTADMVLKDFATFGDPFMTIIPPVVQYLNDYVLPTEKGLRESPFIAGYTIAVPQSEFFNSPSQDGSSILVNGEAVVPDEEWVELFCSNREICGYAARVEIAPQGVVSIRHTNPSAAISAWVYGIAGAVSFGYTAGFKLDEVAFPTLCIENVTVNETLGQAMVTLTRTGDIDSGGSRFFLTVVDGSATSPADYSVNYTVSESNGIADELVNNATTRELRMSTGIAELILTFSIAQDGIDEDPEDFFLFLEGTRRIFVLCPVGSVTIIDRIPPPVEVGFAPVQYTVNEAGEFAVLTIIKRRTTIETVSVDFTTLPGTALAIDDYQTTTRTLSFLPSQTVSRLSVPIVRDTTAEPTEQFFGDLSNPMGRVTIFEPRATVEIIDNDTPVRIGFTARDYTVREDNGTVTVCLRKDVDTQEDLMLNVTARDCDPPDALANQDYTPATNAVIFPANARVVCTSFGIIDDDILEDPELFCVDFEVQPLRDNVPVERVIANSLVTILDDELPPPVLPQKPDDAPPVFVASGDTVQIGCDVCFVVPPPDPVVQLNCTPIGGTPPFTYNWFRGVNLNVMTPLLTVTEEGNYTCEVSDPEGGMATANSIVAIAPAGVFRPTITNAGQVQDGNGCSRVQSSDSGNPSVLCAVLRDTIDLECTTSTSPPDGDVRVVITRQPSGEVVADGFGSVSTVIDVDTTVGIGGRYRCTATHPVCGDQENELNVIVRGLGGEIRFELPDYTVIENNGTVTVCLSSTDPVTDDLTLEVTASMKQSSPFPATDNSDYVPETQTVIFRAGTSRACTSFTIIDDTIALEENEQFRVDFVDPSSTLQLSSCVTIIDDDDVAVSFVRMLWPVPENNGTVFVCVNISNGIARDVLIVVNASEKDTINAATADVDFRPEAIEINFPASLVGGEMCISFVIFADDELEGEETFNLDIISGDEVMEAPYPQSWVLITDIPPPTPGCIVSDPLMVSPFVIAESYNFMGTCEHTLVTSCSDDVDFSVTVDFLAADLANGRIGVRYMNRRFTYREDGTVDTGSEDPIDQVGDTREYADQVFITQNAAETILDFRSVGVQVVIANNQFQVNVADSTALGETCGLCGNQDGTLLFSNRSTVANIMNTNQVMAFANSWLVPVRDQFLRDIRRECAQLTNDTVIGDPLFTVPFSKRGDALCYEVHGSPDQNYNLVSDVCTNVNAFYNDAIAVDGYGSFEANFIQMIGVRAVGSSGVCQNIRVFEDENGVCSVMRMGAPDVFPLGTSEDDGIIVRRVRNRVRISVPNCEHISLVMWITCEARSGVRSLRFDISRGLNLRPTSHGLIGQFWNINITVEPFTGTVDVSNGDDLHIVTVIPTEGSPRRFLANRNSIAWDKSRRPCYYAGNSQGGPWGVGPNVPVIQGRYTNYRVGGLFEHEFVYAQFENERCTN